MSNTDTNTERPVVSLALRLSETDRAEIKRLARRYDRTPSSEVRRAIRYYLSHFETADRALRDACDGGR
jgi:predicted DNA-binding protein